MNLESKDGRAIASRLHELGEADALLLARRILDDPATSPIPEHDVARTVKAGELFKVWDARVRFAELKGRTFPGAKGLVERLRAIPPATELVLHHLENSDTVGLFYFRVDDDTFVGLVLADQMLPFKLVYSDAYYLPIGQHVFPAEKYRRVRDRLISTGVAQPQDFLEPQPATDQDILLVHKPDYVQKLKTGTLSPREAMELEVPFSPELVNAFWLAAGGSILAARQALTDRICISIGGGFHHAFPDHGEGFCMIHDVAVAIRRLQRDDRIHTAMTVDCDVHQGNGTAAIFAGTRTESVPLPSASSATLTQPASNTKMRGAHAGDVFTISLHQHNNYPVYKPPSSIDVDLPDGTGDDDYLAWLDNALSSGLRQFEPDLLCYIAGADPYREDQLGGLDLSIEGLKKRDELVFRVAQARDIPIMVTYAGGYARNVEDTVAIHTNTVIAAKQVFEK